MVYPEMVQTPERRHAMTYEGDYSIPEEVLEQICSEGFDVLPELIRIIVNYHHQRWWLVYGAPRRCDITIAELKTGCPE